MFAERPGYSASKEIALVATLLIGSLATTRGGTRVEAMSAGAEAALAELCNRVGGGKRHFEQILQHLRESDSRTAGDLGKFWSACNPLPFEAVVSRLML